MLLSVVFSVVLHVVLGYQLPFNDSSGTVMFQAFNWDVLSNRGALWSNIQNMAPDLANSGFNGVWFPPPTQSADTQGYMPGEWYTIINPSALSSAVNAVRSSGMIAICDIVINHRTAASVNPCTSTYANFQSPNWGPNAIVVNDYECQSSNVFCPGNCNCGGADTGDNFCPAPDIDHTNTQIQNDIVSWLNWLKQNYGFNGWRFDLVKGYSGSFVGKYVSASNPSFSVGEYWDGDLNKVTAWISATGGNSLAFDFPLRYVIKDAINNNNFNSLKSGFRPPGVVGVDPTHAAPFVDNHDTARTERFGGTTQILQGYAYILTHNGVPFVFYQDWNDGNMKAAIKNILSVRKQYRLGSNTGLFIDQATLGLYSVYLGGATQLCGGTVAMKLGTNNWTPCGSGWNLATSGNNFAIWTKKIN